MVGFTKKVSLIVLILALTSVGIVMADEHISNSEQKHDADKKAETLSDREPASNPKLSDETKKLMKQVGDSLGQDLDKANRVKW